MLQKQDINFMKALKWRRRMHYSAAADSHTELKSGIIWSVSVALLGA